MKSPNPSGLPKVAITHGALTEMCSHFGSMRMAELLALENDPKRFNRLSVFQQMVFRRITESMRKDSEGRLNFAEVMDRLIGKPKQSIESEIKLTLEQLVMGSYTGAPPELPEPVVIDATPEPAPKLSVDDLI